MKGVATLADLVSIRQFAKLDGCSHTLVQRAISEGRLPVSADGKLDPALAGSDWRKKNRTGNAGGNGNLAVASVATSGADIDPAGMNPEDFIAEVLAGRFKLIGDAERVKENALAAKNLLAARKEAGDVVDIETAEAVLFEAARSTRDAWINFPARVGPLLAAELGVESDRVVEALTAHVQQQLQDLGEPDPDFSGSR